MKQIFEYHGIVKPWDPASDFLTNEQHALPNPKAMYKTVESLLSVWESIKEKIADELLKVETYVKRAKGYMKEDYMQLGKYYERLCTIIVRLKSAKSGAKQNILSIRFTNDAQHSHDIIENFKGLKGWLLEVLCLFGTLF